MTLVTIRVTVWVDQSIQVIMPWLRGYLSKFGHTENVHREGTGTLTSFA